jgi:hypothetical protein
MTELFEVRRVIPGMEGTLKVSAMSIMTNARQLAHGISDGTTTGSLKPVDQDFRMLLSMVECDNVNQRRVITDHALRQEIVTALQAALAYFQQRTITVEPVQYHELEILLATFAEPR